MAIAADTVMPTSVTALATVIVFRTPTDRPLDKTKSPPLVKAPISPASSIDRTARASVAIATGVRAEFRQDAPHAAAATFVQVATGVSAASRPIPGRRLP